MSVLGVVLAGGASRRMGGRDKLLERIGGETLLARALRRLAPQVDRIVVNGPLELEAHVDVEIVPDGIVGRAGPLAGVLAAIDASRENVVLTVAADTPFFPPDLAERLAVPGVTVARWESRMQPVFTAWPVDVRDRLAAFLERGERKIMAFAAEEGFSAVDFPDGGQAFFNVNTVEDLEAARHILETRS